MARSGKNREDAALAVIQAFADGKVILDDDQSASTPSRQRHRGAGSELVAVAGRSSYHI